MKALFPTVLILVLAVGSLLAQQSTTAGGDQGKEPEANVSSTSQVSPAQAGATTTPGAPNAKPAEKKKSSAANADPLLEPPPLPETKVSLVGGTVTKIDKVRNRLTLKPFGSDKKMTLVFDDRSRFFVNGVETTFAKIRTGDRVYVDTQLDGVNVLARNVRVINESGPADARGQIVDVDGKRFMLRDDLSSQAFEFAVTDETTVKRDGARVGVSELVPGALVALRFTPEKGNTGLAQEVEIIAMPGDTFTFAGTVMHLDLSAGLLAVQNGSDQQTYDVHFNPEANIGDLAVGANVTIKAAFDGQRYMARNIEVEEPPASEERNQ